MTADRREIRYKSAHSGGPLSAVSSQYFREKLKVPKADILMTFASIKNR
jgi:hypothetical protein